MNRIIHNEKGVALVLTIAIVAILLSTALQMGKFTGDSVMSTLLEKDQFQADQLALSGINIAMVILVDDAEKSTIDTVQEAWADPEKLSQAANELKMENETLTIKITDELSKIQINALINEFYGNQLSIDQNQIWENFLNLKFLNDKSIDKRTAAEIINSVKDWLDSRDNDAISGISGAESDYYLSLDPPYVCANGPFNHIDELLNVKGISKDLFKTETLDQTHEQVDKLALSDIFTIYGMDKEKTGNGGYRYSGKVNINTAGVDVVAGILPEGMEDLAQELIDYREQKSEEGDIFLNPLDKGWYKKVIDLSDKEQDRLDRIIIYSSDTFKVECAVQKNNATAKLVAFLKKEKHEESGKIYFRIIQIERK
ncbi:general secretion pathway protein GspK [Desulfobacula sp.]